MLKKGSILYSILTGSCPKCHQESMYLKKNPYNLSTIYSMHEKCSHCNTKYQMEPSFFYGAMYVGYALSVAAGVGLFVISKLLLHASFNGSLLTIIIGLILLTPIIARLSRNIYINLFIKYEKNWKENL